MPSATDLGRWRVLCWILVIVVPLQAMLSLQLMTSGPSHAHFGADRGDARPHTPAQAHPKGFEWANSTELLATPSTERIRAALRGKAHGSLKPVKWLASRRAADRDVQAAAHTLAHSTMQRHHHASADSTVVLEPLSALDPARETLGAHGPAMAWAPPTQSEPLRAVSAAGTRVSPTTRRWRSHVPSPPERPPRIRDEALSA